MNGVLTSRGMKTLAARPARAAYAAAALAALPADGTETVVAPSRRATVTAADRPRALKELVGLADSSLMKSRSTPTAAPSRRARTSGVKPSPRVTGPPSPDGGSASR